MPYGKLLKEPAFANLEGYEREAKTLPRLEKLPLFTRVPSATPGAANEERRYERREALFNTRTRMIVNDVDPRFKLVQHQEVADAVFAALQNAPVTDFKGGFMVNKDGTHAAGFVMLLDRPHEGFAPREPGSPVRVGEVFRSGIEWSNHLDGTGMLRFQGIVERVACSNGRIAPTVLGEISVTHMGSVEQTLAELPQGVADILSKCAKYANIWQDADAELVRLNDVPLLLKGIGLPDGGITAVVGNMHKYEPLTRDRLTRATLHEAANYWLNHESNLNWERLRTLTAKAHVLMETKLDRLMEAVIRD